MDNWMFWVSLILFSGFAIDLDRKLDKIIALLKERNSN